MNTKYGKVSIEINEKDKYPNLFIKLNNVPIILIEESFEKDKLVIKSYPNKNVYIDDEYFNLKRYDDLAENIDTDDFLNIMADLLDTDKE